MQLNLSVYIMVENHMHLFLIDQGSDDNFKDKQLFPERLIDACKKASFPIELREQVGYDHSYYFIMTFLEDHFKYHKKEFEHSK